MKVVDYKLTREEKKKIVKDIHEDIGVECEIIHQYLGIRLRRMYKFVRSTNTYAKYYCNNPVLF